VPRKNDHGRRDLTWRWVKRYLRCELGASAEIVIGRDRASEHVDEHGHPIPFSKSVAVNHAASKAKGDIFVIYDADAYLPGRVLMHCAERIRFARDHGIRRWFVPYRVLYRLTEAASDRVLASDPRDPERFPSPPDPADVEDTAGSGHGHLFGAMVMVMPREAFFFIGGMDEHFRGWGGEDVSFLRALDTLWAKHRNAPGQILHLWHEKIHIGERVPGNQYATRAWQGQTQAQVNGWLASQYNAATNKPSQMRALVATGLPPKRWRRFRRRWA
jgi:hypothetical protein